MGQSLTVEISTALVDVTIKDCTSVTALHTANEQCILNYALCEISYMRQVKYDSTWHCQLHANVILLAFVRKHCSCKTYFNQNFVSAEPSYQAFSLAKLKHQVCHYFSHASDNVIGLCYVHDYSVFAYFHPSL